MGCTRNRLKFVAIVGECDANKQARVSVAKHFLLIFNKRRKRERRRDDSEGGEREGERERREGESTSMEIHTFTTTIEHALSLCFQSIACLR
jgi:hypothetical protein